MTLTPVQQWALDQLLPPDEQTGVLLDDLAAAFAKSKTQHTHASLLRGHIVEAAHAEAGSWDLAAEVLHEPRTNLWRWAAERRPLGEDDA
jgi:hypothetical protein